MSVALQEFVIVAAAVLVGQWLFHKLFNQPEPLAVPSSPEPAMTIQLSGDPVRDFMDRHF